MTTPPPFSEQKSATPCTCRSGILYVGVILITLFMAVVVTAVITYVMPKKFESKAVIQVNNSFRVGTALGHDSLMAPLNTPQHFTSSELEVMRAHLTLQLVVQQLNLTALWGVTEDEAINLLRTMITTQNIRGTDLIEIRVRHSNPAVARDVAKGVYEAYKKRREDKVRSIAEEGLKELEKAVLEQSDALEDKRKQRNTLLRMAPVMIRDNLAMPSFEQQAEYLEQERASAVTALAELDTLIKMIDSLGPQEALSYVANLESAGEDFTLAYQEYQQQLLQLAGMTVEGDQSERLAQQAKVESLKALSTRKMASFKDSLKLTRNSKAAALADLEKNLIELNEAAANHTIIMNSIQGAQKEFDNQQAMHDRMTEKLVMERINLKQPMELVVLHEEPVVAFDPYSPNVSLNLFIGAVAGLALGLLIVLLMRLFRGRCKRCSVA
jgi:uncharacterized protein involved in exopolysaccharide biosynthesis